MSIRTILREVVIFFVQLYRAAIIREVAHAEQAVAVSQDRIKAQRGVIVAEQNRLGDYIRAHGDAAANAHSVRTKAEADLDDLPDFYPQ